jgi:CDP-glycerol glycerophosphotransferase
VIVIAHDDRDRLPRAVASALAQTYGDVEIVVVDDASTDGTDDVARELAAAHENVRAIVLDENTGSPGGPRNAGLDDTDAAWVMFLDSDDELAPEACAVLVEAAIAMDADFVAGLTVRRDVESGREKHWRHRLFQERRVVGGARAMPELFTDPLSTNKLYRRAFIERHALRFPVGWAYEDNLWSVQVYTLAERVGLIPDRVYTWYVEPDAEKPSITQRRHEIGNFLDRLRINREIDAFLDAHGDATLHVAKDVKFLSNDLILYIRELAWRDEDYLRRFVEEAGAYLRGIRIEALREVDPPTRVLAHALMTGDLEEALAAVDLRVHASKLPNPLSVDEAGRVHWVAGPGHDVAPELDWLLDVTDLGEQHVPLAQWVPYVDAEVLGAHGTGIDLTITLHDRLDRLTDGASVPFRLEVGRRGEARTRLELGTATVIEDRVGWVGTVDLAGTVVPSEGSRYVDVVLVATIDGTEVTGSLAVDPRAVDGVQLVLSEPGASGHGITLDAYATRYRNLAFEVTPTTGPGTAAADARRARESTTSAPSGRGHRATAIRYRALQVLPRRGVVVFEHLHGRGAGGDPLAVHGAMRRIAPHLRSVWSASGSEPREAFPPDADVVERGSWDHLAALARASAWVDDDGVLPVAALHRHGRYVQTWHETPLVARKARRDGARWTDLVVPSEHAADALASAHSFAGTTHRFGSPRNDRLVHGLSDDDRAALRSRLGLPADRTIALFAPAASAGKAARDSYRSAVDFDRLYERLGGEAYVIVREDPRRSWRLARRHGRIAVDHTAHPDVTELMLVADVLVTDHAPVLVDFAVQRRPIVLLHPEHDARPRLLVDLAAQGPGPTVATTDELADLLADLPALRAATEERLGAFADRFCAYERGDAAERVVRELLLRR